MDADVSFSGSKQIDTMDAESSKSVKYKNHFTCVSYFKDSLFSNRLSGTNHIPATKKYMDNPTNG